jgi:rhodanese-related sulfurtransferase
MSSPKKPKRFLIVPIFCSPQELVDQLDHSVVIDVRDAQEILESGKIINSINIPSTFLLNNLQEIYNNHKQFSKIIFHCALSQVRGPKCAQAWCTMINENEHRTDQQVYILRGGFDHFKGIYGLDMWMFYINKLGYPLFL